MSSVWYFCYEYFNTKRLHFYIFKFFFLRFILSFLFLIHSMLFPFVFPRGIAKYIYHICTDYNHFLYSNFIWILTTLHLCIFACNESRKHNSASVHHMAKLFDLWFILHLFDYVLYLLPCVLCIFELRWQINLNLFWVISLLLYHVPCTIHIE